jgi:transketolase
VVDCYSIKPIDKKTLINLTQKTKKVVVVEDHYPDGGLGDAVREALINRKIELHHLAVKKIPGSATPQEQIHFEEIDSQAIFKKIKEII